MSHHPMRRLWSSSARRRPATGRGTLGRRRGLTLEALEQRQLLTVQPVGLADPSLTGQSGMLASSAPSISADGQLVAFASSADNLVPNDSDNVADAFVYSRATGAVSLVSVGPDGQAAGIGGYSSPMAPVISPDGRYVVFENNRSDVLTGISGDELYLRDLSTGTTTLVTAAANGSGGGDRGSRQAVFSADSHQLGFIGDGDDLVAGIKFNSPGQDNVFERNLITNTTSLVSISEDGMSDGDSLSNTFGLSADGEFVVFSSTSTNLTPQSVLGQDNHGVGQVYLRDTVHGTTTMVSINMNGTAGGNSASTLDAGAQVISADGRYVVFSSAANDLTVTPPQYTESYLRDLRTGTTTLVSASPVDGQPVKGGSEAISPDGRYVAFASSSRDVVSLPTQETDVYVYTIQTGILSLASVNAAGTAGGNAGSGIGPFFDIAGGLSFSANGRYLAFRSLATDLTPDVVTANRNLYVRDLDAGKNLLVTPDLAGTDGGAGDSDTITSAVFSADGRYIAFEDTAANLVPGDNNVDSAGNGANDVFVRDLTAGATALASRRSPLLPLDYTGAGGSTLGSTSADGNLVVFTSDVFYGVSFNDLAPGVKFISGASVHHVFVRNRQSGAITVVDVDPSGDAVGGYNPTISADGRYVAFIGYTTLLPSGIATSNSGDLEVFVRDLQTNTTSAVSLDPSGTHDAPVDGRELVISAQGRYVAWSSVDSSAVAGTISASPGNYHMLFLRDRQTGKNYLVSHDPQDDGQVDGSSSTMSITGDGRYVAFLSTDGGLTGQSGGTVYPQVFRWDRSTGQVALVSVNAAGTGPGNGGGDNYSYPPSMSADGRYIAFTSESSDLTPDATSGVENVFLRDMGDGTSTPVTTLVSANSAGTSEGNNNSIFPSISADGSVVAFMSQATDLTATPDTNNGLDVFVRNMTTNKTALVSINSVGTAAATGDSYPESRVLALSPDGRYVAFISDTVDLVAGYAYGIDANNGDLYIRDLQDGLTRLVSASQSGTGGGRGNQYNQPVTFSGDSGTLAFNSDDTNLYPDDHNKAVDVFAVKTAGYGRITGQVFNDLNGNGANNSEPGLPYWTVFLDANKNGTLDAGEESVISDSLGSLRIQRSDAGDVHRLTRAPGRLFRDLACDARHSHGDRRLRRPIRHRRGLRPVPAAARPGGLRGLVHSERQRERRPATQRHLDRDQSRQRRGRRQLDRCRLPIADQRLGAGAVLLTTVPHNGGLAGGQSYTGRTTTVLPPLPGSYFVIVQADTRNQVFEGAFGANKSNDVARASSTLIVSVPLLTLGGPTIGQLTAGGPDQYWQFTAPAGQSLVLTLKSAATSGQVELYLKRGSLPTDFEFDFAARTPAGPGQVLTVPTAQPGVYYVLVHGVSGAALSASFTLTATEPGLGLQSLGLASGGNGGQVTIPVHGTDLTPSTQVSLVSGSTVLAPVSIAFQDGSLLFATFNLAGEPTGTYTSESHQWEPVGDAGRRLHRRAGAGPQPSDPARNAVRSPQLEIGSACRTRGGLREHRRHRHARPGVRADDRHESGHARGRRGRDVDGHPGQRDDPVRGQRRRQPGGRTSCR